MTMLDIRIGRLASAMIACTYWSIAHAVEDQGRQDGDAVHPPIEVTASHEYSTYECRKWHRLLKAAEDLSSLNPLIRMTPFFRVKSGELSMEDMIVQSIGPHGNRTWRPDEIGRVAMTSDDLSPLTCDELRVNRPKSVLNAGLYFSLQWREDGHYSAADLREACRQYTHVFQKITQPLLPIPRRRPECTGWRFLYLASDPVAGALMVDASGESVLPVERDMQVPDLAATKMRWNILGVPINETDEGKTFAVRVATPPFIIVPRF